METSPQKTFVKMTINIYSKFIILIFLINPREQNEEIKVSTSVLDCLFILAPVFDLIKQIYF